MCKTKKKQTECVLGSEKYMQTKNGRLMMKCKCAECGIIKTRFVKKTGRGIGETINKKIGERFLDSNRLKMQLHGYLTRQEVTKIYSKSIGAVI